MIPESSPAVARAPPVRLATVAAACAAVAAAGVLGWWASAPDRPPVAPPVRVQPLASGPAPLRFAPAQPDPDQVRSALGQVRSVYVNGGPDALLRASVDCARRLQVHPGQLDHCLAFDIYAADVLPPSDGDGADSDWFDESGDRAIALARAALPAGVDAANRVSQVRALTMAVLPRLTPADVDRGVRRASARDGPRGLREATLTRPRERLRAKALHGGRGRSGREPETAAAPPPSGPDLSKIVPPT